MEPFSIAILYYSSALIITTVSTYMISIYMGNVMYNYLEKNVDKCRLYF
jgi:hypothetical protein